MQSLAAVIGNPQNELHVLHVDGSPAGFAELDRRQPEEVELVQFGLMPDFIGTRAGKVVPAMDRRESVELPAKPVLAAHLHAGSSRCRAHLQEGRVCTIQGRKDSQGTMSSVLD